MPQSSTPIANEDLSGLLILVIGPSGSGKSELLGTLKEAYPDIHFPISATTRAPRPGEVDGEKYHFLSEAAFDERIANGEVLEWAHYGGNRYATLKSEILGPLREGRVVVREVEVQGARAIRDLVPHKNLATIFIDAGGWDVLERRIRERAPISDEELARRKERYDDEVSFKEVADYVIVNEPGKLEETKRAFLARIAELIKPYGISL